MDDNEFNDMDALALTLGDELNVSRQLLATLRGLKPSDTDAAWGALVAAVVQLEQKLEELRG